MSIAREPLLQNRNILEARLKEIPMEPGVYRQCAVAYTDFWDAYALIFPQKRHKAVGKETGKTSYIECFNCTMGQRFHV